MAKDKRAPLEGNTLTIYISDENRPILKDIVIGKLREDPFQSISQIVIDAVLGAHLQQATIHDRLATIAKEMRAAIEHNDSGEEHKQLLHSWASQIEAILEKV